MSYAYATEKPKLFTEDGQVLFLKIRDNVKRLLADAGAFRSDKAWTGCVGDSWQFLAALDRLVELGEIRELTPSNVNGQDRVFVAARR